MIDLIPPNFPDILNDFIADPVATAGIYDPAKLGTYTSQKNRTKHILIDVDDKVTSFGELLERFPVVALSRDSERFPHICCQSRRLFAEEVYGLMPSCLCVAVVEFDENGYTVYVPFGGGVHFKAKTYTTG